MPKHLPDCVDEVELVALHLANANNLVVKECLAHSEYDYDLCAKLLGGDLELPGDVFAAGGHLVIVRGHLLQDLLGLPLWLDVPPNPRPGRKKPLLNLLDLPSFCCGRLR
eukprot:s2233_g9.t1